MATAFEDIDHDIIQKHILPRLDGPSLWATAAATVLSSHLRSLCRSDDKLWADVSISTWPSITHPRVHEIISTFPNGHRSFFEDSFPSLLTLNSQQKDQWFTCDDHPFPFELVSLVDIRYKGAIIYSKAHFTNTTTGNFLYSSPFQIVLNEPTHVPEKLYDQLELLNDDEKLSFLKESVTLNWVIINPTQKRAGNLSTIKPVSVRYGWVSNEVVLRYITVLPGCNPNDMVKCRIQLVLLVAGIAGDAILQVKEVSLKLQDLFSRNCLNGKDFMVITQRAILEENNVRRTVIDDEKRLMSYMQHKQMKRDKKRFGKNGRRENEVCYQDQLCWALVVVLLLLFLPFIFVSTLTLPFQNL